MKTIVEFRRIFQWESLEKDMRMIITPLHTATKTLMHTLDADTEALNGYLTIQKMSEITDEEKHL